ncbi:hypothetical protein EDC01DRAFT_363061 [Geopyxis carbonaria]|nr:hypothetical protein EDC01DRAFT_363061 [Geopyxis carbonaria]
MTSSDNAQSLHPPSSLVPTITPASPYSLAIYNPSLGPTDDTLQEQLVFFTSSSGASHTLDEKLRQIGLAQGVVEFARGFSRVNNCTIVETQKARFITIEIEEPGWWLLTQIELSYIHNPTTHPAVSEYSAREVSPVQILVSQLRKAYAQFRFRYGTFQSNWDGLERSIFYKRLEKYWHRWVWKKWEIMLKGSPVVNLLSENYIKMSGGRPGQELRSQERDFLEGWAKKETSRGLIDLVVTRVGTEPTETLKDVEDTHREPSRLRFWPISITGKGTSDLDIAKARQICLTDNILKEGCIFRGIGEIETSSVIDIITFLAEQQNIQDTINAGDVITGQRRRKNASRKSSTSTIRPMYEETGKSSLGLSRSYPGSDSVQEHPAKVSTVIQLEPNINRGTVSETQRTSNTNSKIMNLITFGWAGHTETQSAAPPTTPTGSQGPTPNKGCNTGVKSHNLRSCTNKIGQFLIGFQGDLDVEDLDDDFDTGTGRITTRSVWVQRKSCSTQSDSDYGSDTIDKLNSNEFKLVIYTNSSLYFAMVFQANSQHLRSPSFYRSIHHQLSPLVQTIIGFPMTSTEKTPLKNSTGFISSPIRPPYHIVLNTSNHCFYSTFPPIPELGNDSLGWTRTDALHVYTITLGILVEKRTDQSNKERSIRSARGWWVNWRRFGGFEGIVVRRAGESTGEVEGTDVIETQKYFEELIK